MKMNKYQIALNEISSAVLDVYADGYNQPRTAQECYCSSFDDGGYIKSIEFVGIKKEIRLHDLETYNDNKSQDVFVLYEYELKAINKQCEELGWI